MANNNTIALLVIGAFLIIGMVWYFMQGVRENFFSTAPCSIHKRCNYVFADYGIGTPLEQMNWGGGAPFQPWAPVDQGLYTTDRWAPRNAHHIAASCLAEPKRCSC